MSNVVTEPQQIERSPFPTLPVVATAVLKVKAIDGSFRTIRMMCDSGSQPNLITEAAAKPFKKHQTLGPTNFVGANGLNVPTKGQVVLSIYSTITGDNLGLARFFILPSMDDYFPSDEFAHVEFPSVKREQLADPRYNEVQPIDGIIGVHMLAMHLRGGVQWNPLGLMAQETTFGWIVSGGNARAETLGQINHETGAIFVTMNDLHAQIKRLWEIEEVQEKVVLSMDEQACEALYESTLVRKENRYSVTLLLKPHQELGDSRAMAVRRLYGLENRLKKSPEVKEKYIEFMREYEKLGHMRRADPVPPRAQYYYIPHHAVAIDRKFRVVFDASAKTSNGLSLNDIQYVGPRLQRDLMDVVMSFRVGQYAISADICKMFRQIEVQPEQWDYQRILWREDASEPVREYWLTVVTYGMASSPYNAVKTLIQCAIDHESTYPRAARVARGDFYVDDLLTSVASPGEAMELKSELNSLLAKGGFELAKWRSNLDRIMEGQHDPKLVQEHGSTSVLGMSWNYERDVFQFKVREPIHEAEEATKRRITSDAARIFDPQGYLAPVTIRARLCIQELWREGVGWDTTLPLNLRVNWQKYWQELKHIEKIEIPRWLLTGPNQPVQIHVFCDASSKAYGAAVYIRTWKDGEWKALLLCSKSRVAPIKSLTIPRLELCAVKLGSLLLETVRTIEQFRSAPAAVWTDSEIVLYWIRKARQELKMFVANRVDVILRAIGVERTYHVPTDQNPADLLSRGIQAEALVDKTLWWNGPSILSEERESWPPWNGSLIEKTIHDQIHEEIKVLPAKPSVTFLTIGTNAQPEELTLMTRYSSLNRVCRITAYVLRFCALCFERIRKNKRVTTVAISIYQNNEWKSDATLPVDNQSIIEIRRLSVCERENALNYWIRFYQEEAFGEERSLIKKEKPVDKGSILRTLSPYLDENEILRVRGRLENATLSEDQKHPIILHGKSVLARRIAEDTHRASCHGGVQLCTQLIRNKYWITGVRVLLRSVTHRCLVCARYRQETSSQFMANLPAARVTPTPAFMHTGTDYAGPITIRVNRNTTTKAYIAVFVCMVYKAVHLELVSSLTSEAFLAALTRFISLRAGSVKHMYSDNGTNFVGANKELKEVVELWEDQEVMSLLQNQGIQWHFSPPYAPHHGGLWEAAVKSTKYHLRRMGGAHLFTFEELSTLLARISACLNSRPLTPVSSDATDVTVLTPAHFVTGGAVLPPMDRPLAEVATNRLSAWHKIQQLQQRFWDRWSQEYITELNKRNKWTDETRSLQVGDMVLVENENTPPCYWIMGRIVNVFPGKDGKVRICEIKTERGTIVRAITKLCLLPIESTE